MGVAKALQRPFSIYTVKFLFFEQIALTGNGIFQMPRKRIATPVCALARNDKSVGFFCFVKQEKR
ncbi:MAG: hypothetical protein IJO28_08570 [Oscillospiraceae bacterium]|nr:hypothetical protein [Oscillospiraceae bacterium]